MSLVEALNIIFDIAYKDRLARFGMDSGIPGLFFLIWQGVSGKVFSQT